MTIAQRRIVARSSFLKRVSSVRPRWSQGASAAFSPARDRYRASDAANPRRELSWLGDAFGTGYAR